MKRLVLILVAVVAAAGVAPSAAALAHNTPFAWTAPKARLMLQEGTTIALPPDQRAALDVELEALLDQFRLLELTAQEERGDWLLAETYHNYVTRFRKAQDTVNAGLSIDSAKCAGLGKALKGKRYKHFRCTAKSYALEIPSVELKYAAEGALPEVIEGPARRIGPLQAVFTIHVTGKTRMLVRRIG